MSSLALAAIVHLALLLPVVAICVWGWHRYSAPLLLDTLDADDEMTVGAVHRLTTLTYALLALGLVFWQVPDKQEVAGGVGPAVLSSVALVLLLLGSGHAWGLHSFLRRRSRREQASMPQRVWGPPPGPPPAPLYLAPPVYAGPIHAGPGPARPMWGPPFYAPAPADTAPWGNAIPSSTAGSDPHAWPPAPRSPHAH